MIPECHEMPNVIDIIHTGEEDDEGEVVVNNEAVSSILDSGVTVAQQMMSVLDDGEDRLIENPMRKRKDRGCDHDDDDAEEIIQPDPKKVHCDDETSSLAVGNGGSVDATFASLIGAPPVPIPVTHINNIDEETSAAWEGNLHHIQQSKPSKEEKKWDDCLQLLRRYKQDHGDCLVSSTFENQTLAKFVTSMRSQYKRFVQGKQCSLTEDRIQLLNSEGFVWELRKRRKKRNTDGNSFPAIGGVPVVSVSSNIAWVQYFEALLAYKEKYGDCLVPQNFAGNPQLGKWVSNQRTAYKLLQEGKKSTLTNERVERLKNVGFQWSAFSGSYKTYNWDENFKALKEYREKHGNCNVPHNKERPELWKFVSYQRSAYKMYIKGMKSKLTDAQVNALEDIGFKWVAEKKDVWEIRFRELVSYKEKYGSTLVPSSYPENPPLGKWVGNQRSAYRWFTQGDKRSWLTRERIQALSDIGFAWNVRERSCPVSWEERVTELKAYRNEYGDCLVPQSFNPNPPLGKWVGNQREEYRKRMQGKRSSMTDQRVRILEDVGFVWSCRP
mmetsp:Transcript_28390/g.41783  ORF Transcript_28390/g.41783 Transcript_28390/m.41783 type:complete len:554 (-) Transcript_28390:161-1822(-)